MKRREARKQALCLLYEADLRGATPLELARRAGNLDSYTLAIIEGISASSAEIDRLIRENAENWEFDRISIVDREILRIATWEIAFTDLSAAVAIDEAIEIAKEFSGENSGKFINGVLGGIVHTVRAGPKAESSRE